MSNKYNSSIRSFFARNVAEVVISPPTDLVLASTDFHPQIFRYGTPDLQVVLPESNILVKALGIFCNFADGLVLHSPAARFDIEIRAFAVTALTPLTGTVDFVNGSRALAGAGTNFNPEISVGDIIVADIDPYNHRYSMIRSITDDDTATLEDYIDFSVAGMSISKATIAADPITRILKDVPAMNYMFSVDQFLFPSYTAGINPIDIVLTVRVNNSLPDATTDVTLLTKSIDTSFVDDTAIFDVAMDLEFTQASS